MMNDDDDEETLLLKLWCINMVINGQSKLSVCTQLSVPIDLCLLQAYVVKGC